MIAEADVESRAAKIVGYLRRFVGRRAFAVDRDDIWSMARTIAAEALASGKDESWACRKASRTYKREWKWSKRKLPLDGRDFETARPFEIRPIPDWYFATCSPMQENAVRRRYEQDLTWQAIGTIYGTSYEAIVIHHRRALKKIRELIA